MLGILTILAVSGWPSAQVRVQASAPVAGAESELLEARLADRLLGAGWTLAPVDAESDARVAVSVDGDLARVTVECGGDKRVSFVRQPIGEVLSLDVVHRVIESLEAASPAHEGVASSGIRVGLAFDDAPGRGEAALALRDQGIWVVPALAPASWRICVRRSDDAYRLVRARGLDCSPPLADTIVVQRDGLVEAVSRQGGAIHYGSAPVDTTLAREVDESLARSAAIARVARTPRPPPNPRLLRTSVEGGLTTYRAIDPALGARLEIGRRTGAAGSFRINLMPSAGDQFRAVDTLITAGAKLRGNFGVYFDAWLGVAAGTLIHRYDHFAEPVVTRVDPAFAVPAGLSFTARNGVGFSLALNQSYTFRDRRYIRDGAVIWERPGYRVGVSVGVHYERVLR